MQCFETIDYCKYELGLPTVCGLSNISFGMPNRQFVNTTYLTIAVSRGLTMAIANPNQEMLMYCAAAADTLMNKPGALEKYSSLPVVEAKTAAAASAGGASAGTGGGLTVASACEGLSVIAQCVVKGKRNRSYLRLIRPLKRAWSLK